MRQVSIAEIENNLSNYLQIAEQEGLVIIRDKQPVGILIGFDNSEDSWEELLHDPRFETEIAQARQHSKEEQSISIEELRAKYSIEQGQYTQFTFQENRLSDRSLQSFRHSAIATHSNHAANHLNGAYLPEAAQDWTYRA